MRTLSNADSMVSPHDGRLCIYRIVSSKYPPFDGRGTLLKGSRWVSPGRLVVQVSETIERLAHLYVLSFLIFRDPIDTSRFMLEPHPELGDRKPVDVALTEVGGREVEDVIERGLYGLPA